jgi:hypothetical protein
MPLCRPPNLSRRFGSLSVSTKESEESAYGVTNEEGYGESYDEGNYEEGVYDEGGYEEGAYEEGGNEEGGYEEAYEEGYDEGYDEAY